MADSDCDRLEQAKLAPETAATSPFVYGFRRYRHDASRFLVAVRARFEVRDESSGHVVRQAVLAVAPAVLLDDVSLVGVRVRLPLEPPDREEGFEEVVPKALANEGRAGERLDRLAQVGR